MWRPWFVVFSVVLTFASSSAQFSDCPDEDADEFPVLSIPNAECPEPCAEPSACVRDFAGSFVCRESHPGVRGQQCKQSPNAFSPFRITAPLCDASQNLQCRSYPSICSLVPCRYIPGYCVQLVGEGESCVEDRDNEEYVGCAGQTPAWTPQDRQGVGQGPALTCREGVCVKADVGA